ncbi:MAG: thrombospondin type 3 repeat-containing protein [Thermodesulfovibrionales bacterium]
MSRKYFIALLAVVLVLGAFGSSFAVSSYVNSFSSTYPGSASSSFSCSLCHTSVPTRNAYGAAYAAANHNFRTIESQDSDGDTFSNLAEITAGTNPGSSASKPASPPPPAACTSFTYSAWTACQSNNTQTRTVTSSLPAGCTGGSPVLSQACTYVPPVTACTSFTYSAWTACQSNNTQTRTVTSSLPAGCTGGSPVLNQACTYVPPVNACTSFTYSAWGACQSNNTQSRSVVSSLPAGCTGSPSASQLTQICNYVPPAPPPPTQIMPVPASEESFSYDAVAEPVVSAVPAQAKPIGLGSVASGGGDLDVKVKIGPFADRVDVSLIIYAPAIDPEDLYFMRGSELKLLSDAVDDDEQQRLSKDSDSDNNRSKKFRRLTLWKANVTQVNENIYSGPASELPSGYYTLVLVVKAEDEEDNSYRWVTHLRIP